MLPASGASEPDMIRRPTSRAARAALAISLLSLLFAATAAAPAAAQQGTVTAQACAQGRIRDSSGQPISRARCDQLIGQPIQLAATGLDVWLIALAGVACVSGALLMRRRSPARA
jgi:hypothetical protein